MSLLSRSLSLSPSPVPSLSSLFFPLSLPLSLSLALSLPFSPHYMFPLSLLTLYFSLLFFIVCSLRLRSFLPPPPPPPPRRRREHRTVRSRSSLLQCRGWGVWMVEKEGCGLAAEQVETPSRGGMGLAQPPDHSRAAVPSLQTHPSTPPLSPGPVP